MLSFQGVLNLQKILIPLRWWRGRGNSFAELISVGFDSCAKDDIIRKTDPVESPGVLGLDQEGLAWFLLNLGYYLFQIVGGAEDDITVGTGENELHVPCSWYSVGQSLRVLMWDEVAAVRAVLFASPLGLPLKRGHTVSAVMFTPHKRVPLFDRQLIHIGAVWFHVLAPFLSCFLNILPMLDSCFGDFETLRADIDTDEIEAEVGTGNAGCARMGGCLY